MKMNLQPIKTKQLPAYAAALAASALLLTGCGGKVQIAGDMVCVTEPVDSVLQTEGDAPVTESYETLTAEALKEGFARQGVSLVRVTEPADFCGEYQDVSYADANAGIMVCFYKDTLQTAQRFSDGGAVPFAWGYAGETQYPRGGQVQAAYRTAFVNVAACEIDDFTADFAEQIAKDLLGETGVQDHET